MAWYDTEISWGIGVLGSAYFRTVQSAHQTGMPLVSCELARFLRRETYGEWKNSGMRYEFWKRFVSRVSPACSGTGVTLPVPRKAARMKPRADHIFPKVYNVALYSTWEAQ